MQKVSQCLWFDTQAQEAAEFYVSVFRNSKIGDISYYGETGQEIHGKKAGSVMTVGFELDGQEFLALNGGPRFKFNEAISLVVKCKDQKELDYFWEKLSEGGDPAAQQCGWLKDKYGLSWQVIPENIGKLIGDPSCSENVMSEILQMKKIDIAKLQSV